MEGRRQWNFSCICCYAYFKYMLRHLLNSFTGLILSYSFYSHKYWWSQILSEIAQTQRHGLSGYKTYNLFSTCCQSCFGKHFKVYLRCKRLHVMCCFWRKLPITRKKSKWGCQSVWEMWMIIRWKPGTIKTFLLQISRALLLIRNLVLRLE